MQTALNRIHPPAMAKAYFEIEEESVHRFKTTAQQLTGRGEDACLKVRTQPRKVSNLATNG